MLSLSPLTVLPCSPIDQIDAAHAAGFDAVGLRLQGALPTDIDVMANASLLLAIERRLSGTKLHLLEVDVVRIGPNTDIAKLEPLLRYAGDLGATNVVFTSLQLDEYRAEDESDLAAKIAAVCDLARRYHVRPTVEFIPFRGIDSLATALRIAKLVNHPNFAVCLDALHFHRSGGVPADLTQVDPGLLASLQLCDAPLTAPDDLPHESRYARLYPGEGALPLVALLQAAPVDIPISVEVPNIGQPTRSPRDRAQRAAECARRVLAAAGRG